MFSFHSAPDLERADAGARPRTQTAGAALSLFLPADKPSEPSPLGRPAPSLADRAAAWAGSGLAAARRCFRTDALRVLSLWWVLGSVIGSYCENYATNLFEVIAPDTDDNGHVTFFTRSLCCGAALLAIRTERAASGAGVVVYVAGTVAAFALLCCLAGSTTLSGALRLCHKRERTRSVSRHASERKTRHAPPPPPAGAYVSYAATMAVMQFLQATLFAQCAHAVDEAPAEADGGAADAWGRGGYAVLFSLNGALSLAVQTAVQAFAASSRMSTRSQFWLLAGYSAAVAVVTAGCGVAVRRKTGAWRLTHSGVRGGGGGGGGRGAYAALDHNTGGDIPMRVVDEDEDDWRIGAAAGSKRGGDTAAAGGDRRGESRL